MFESCTLIFISHKHGASHDLFYISFAICSFVDGYVLSIDQNYDSFCLLFGKFSFHLQLI